MQNYDIFFVNQFTELAQDTFLFTTNSLNENRPYDYGFEINIGESTLNTLFNERTYMENSLNPGKVDINFTLNFTKFTSILKSDCIGYNVMDSMGGTFTSGLKPFSFRMLEIVAHKIFGHAQARAAIANDSDFEGLVDAVIDGMGNSLNSVKDDIYAQYVYHKRAIPPENHNMNFPIPFDFDLATIKFPILLQGKLIGDSIEALKEGPSVGGTQLVNGQYNIPFILSFST